MINFRKLLDDDMVALWRLCQKLSEAVETYNASAHESPFDIQDISENFDEVVEIIDSLKQYFERIDKDYPEYADQEFDNIN